MKIKIVSQNFLDELKGNLRTTYNEYGKDVKKFINNYDDTTRFLDTKYDYEPFELNMSSDLARLTDFDNVKIVYSNLMSLTNSEASDERLWAWFCLDPYWDYVQYRWQVDGNHNENSVRNHFFFGSHSRRAYTRNAIARLWWIGRFTYDKNRENPFELTEYVCESQDVISHILERNISNNFEITKVIIQALIDARNNAMTMNTDDIAELMKYLNFLGATYVLDFQTMDWVYQKTSNKIKRIHASKERNST